MAFVYRSTTRNFLDLKPLSLGPGEYNSEISKTQGRLLHQNNLKYSKIIKNQKNPPIIPFNTTSQRSQINKYDTYMPGPGSYTLYNNKHNISNNLNNSLSLEKDIIDIISINSPISTKKGFLSSEKRLKNLSNTENISPGPGSYEIKSEFNKTNNNKNKRKKICKEKIFLSTEKIASIPDKTKGQFKIIKGILTEIKNKDNDNNGDINDLGPGKYNLFQKWEIPGIIWDKGYKKEEKSKLNESKIQKELEQNSTMFNTENYSEKFEKMRNLNNSTISSSFKSKINNNISNAWNTTSNLNYKNTSSSLTNNNSSQGLIRNKIFHDFLINKKNHYLETVSKNNYKNNLMLDLEYSTSPGPGFYDQNLIPRHVNFSSTVQNFGSNSPKNYILKNKGNDILGPGAYFKDKNKYEKKFKNSVHLTFPEKQKIKIENSVYVENLIKKNKEKHPGVGEYDLETDIIKKNISNNKSFGSNVERFNKEEKNNSTKKDENNIKVYINRNNEDYMIKEFHRKKKIKYLKQLEKIKKKEKLNRKKYVTKNIPSVGTYSPEITSSIYYNVLSKMNPYRNSVAPFNMVNTRFNQIKNPRIKKLETPGPADYNVLKAFNAINTDKRKYNIFGQNEQRQIIVKNIPGPGLYNLDKPDYWNIKSFNVLFINNNNRK